MPEFLFIALDKHRQEVAERFAADTLVQADVALRELGHSRIRFYTDDIGAVSQALFESPVKLPALKAIAYTTQPMPGPLRSIWTMSKQLGPTLIVIPMLTVYLVVSGHWLWACVPGSLLAFFMVMPLWITRATRLFTRLNRAKVWQRWDQVLAIAVKLGGIKRGERPSVPAPWVAQMRAEALAGLGRMDEALVMFRGLEDHPKVPRWYSLTMLAAVHSIARNRDRALELMRQAAALKPDSAMIAIDLASLVAEWLQDGPQAGEILEKVVRLPMHELCRPHISQLRGLIAMADGQWPQAVEHLRRAIEEFAIWRSNTLVEGSIFRATVLLCIAEGRNGKRPEARKLLGKVRKFLRALDDRELTQRCMDAAGP